MSKKEDKEKRINDIIDAAVDLILEKGYEGTSMNEIASKAGISKGGLYHHFLSKELVLLHASKKLMEPIEELMETANRSLSPKDGLYYYINSYIKYWLEHKREFKFFSLSMNKAMNQKDIFKVYENFTEDYISFFEQLFRKGIVSGEFKDHDSRNQGIALMSALDGVAIYMILDKKMKLSDVVDGFKKLFIDSIST